MWMEVVKIELKKCNLSKNLGRDRSEWRNKIHAADHNIAGTRLWRWWWRWWQLWYRSLVAYLLAHMFGNELSVFFSNKYKENFLLRMHCCGSAHPDRPQRQDHPWISQGPTWWMALMHSAYCVVRRRKLSTNTMLILVWQAILWPKSSFGWHCDSS